MSSLPRRTSFLSSLTEAPYAISSGTMEVEPDYFFTQMTFIRTLHPSIYPQYQKMIIRGHLLVHPAGFRTFILIDNMLKQLYEGQ